MMKTFVHSSRLVAFVAALLLVVAAGQSHADLLKLETNTNLRGVYFLPTPDSKKVYVHPVFLAGEADFSGPHGLSHYLEHIMYWHADKVNAEPYHARGGNAWVNGYVTAYYNIGSRNELEDMLIFSRRLLTAPTLDAKFMLNERDVVVREYDFRVSENPDWQAWDVVWPILLPDNPVSRSVIGTPKSIESLTLDHALQFHKKHYSPSNMVLIVAGDLDQNDLVKRIDKAFAGVPAGDLNQQSWRRLSQQGELLQTVELESRYVAFPSVAKAAVGNWQGSGNRLTDYATLLLTQGVLDSALDGGLAKPLRLNNFIFSDYRSDVSQFMHGQFQFYFQGRLDKAVSPEDGSVAFDKALREIAETGIGQKTLDRVRKRLVRKIERQSDDPLFVLGRASADLTYGVMPQSAKARMNTINGVTLANVNMLIKAIANAHRRVTVMMRPEEK